MSKEKSICIDEREVALISEEKFNEYVSEANYLVAKRHPLAYGYLRNPGLYVLGALMEALSPFSDLWEYEFSVEEFFRTVFNGEVLEEDWVEKENGEDGEEYSG